ncbi:spherulation-specific family 4 protein [Aspergillus undulatus]|uniref:spherulation-specific family 4 protein n=1 Tax=Aspergillus undulatus TaxID=1810928 RepID=UPI003CCCCBF1
MGLGKHVRERQCLRSRRSRLVAAALVFVAILAAVLPPAIIVSLRNKNNNNNMGPKAKVFVPLYVYPSPGAWDPLVNVISAHPDVNYTVVVNPGSGPGPNPLPDGNYTQEIPRLTAHDNVRVLGYVATTYANRNISSVRSDIETYAAWPSVSSNPRLAVRGIFFDETPQQYSARTHAYLEELTSIVRNAPGLGPDNFVFHNPGVVPDSRYLSTADSTVVFEATYDTFQERNGARLFEEIPNSDRSQLCAVIHSLPDSVEGGELRGFVKEVRRVADEVFITHLSTDYYASFGDKWSDFVSLMAQ